MAHKASFGKGSETILDEKVRDVWEIDAANLTFKNPAWKSWLATMLNEIKTQLDIEHRTIKASLYKMLIYEKDSFFVWHKDSEKEKDMFATLVINLPSAHTGGELAVRFDGKEVVIDSSEAASNYLYSYAAFYADCDHEVRPLTSGYRICLVYNLLQTDKHAPLSANANNNQINEIANVMTDWAAEFIDDPKAILLKHQYTPSNFSLENLKGDDLQLMNILLKAAEKANYFARLGLVTHYISGELIEDSYHSRYRSRYYEDDDDEEEDNLTDGEMGEIYDDYTEVTYWSNDNLPDLGHLSLSEDDVVANIELGEGEPIKKTAEGYTGNEGMTMDYWYYYGAVILWPKTIHAIIINNLSTPSMMGWLKYYVENIKNDPKSEEYLKQLLSIISQNSNEVRPTDGLDASSLANAWIVLNDEVAFAKSSQCLVPFFAHISHESWVNLITQYSFDLFPPIFKQVIGTRRVSSAVYMLDLFVFMLQKPQISAFVEEQIDLLPSYFSDIEVFLALKTDTFFGYYRKNTPPKEYKLQNKIVNNILIISDKKNDDVHWVKQMAELLSTVTDPEYVNNVLAKTLLEDQTRKKNLLYKKLLHICLLSLEQRTDTKPQPLPNWTRQVPVTNQHSHVWNMLKDFLLSPTQNVFEYRKVAAERNEVMAAVESVTIDLQMHTLKKGSPHTLVLTKNNAAYLKSLSIWKADLHLLEDLRKI